MVRRLHNAVRSINADDARMRDCAVNSGHNVMRQRSSLTSTLSLSAGSFGSLLSMPKNESHCERLAATLELEFDVAALAFVVVVVLATVFVVVVVVVVAFFVVEEVGGVAGCSRLRIANSATLRSHAT